MSQVHGNPQEMRQFARELSNFAKELDSQIRHIDSKSRGIQSSWNDAEYRRFMSDWQQALSGMKRIVKEAPRYSKHVSKKADQLEAYLRS